MMDRVDQTLTYFDPRAEVDRHHHLLPHWEQSGGTYFVTFRLADALPQSKLAAWRQGREAWLARHPPPRTAEQERDYQVRFTHRIERWLDLGHGECLLRQPELGQVMSGALQHEEGRRWVGHCFVVMPNHVHVLFTPLQGHALAEILHTWKSYTASEINRRCGRTGTLWQRTYFDRLIRHGDHFRNCVRYIRKNPVKAGLNPGEFIHFESEWVKGLGIS